MACKIKIILLSYLVGQCQVNKHSSLEPDCKVRANFGSLNISYLKDYGGEWDILIGRLVHVNLRGVFVRKGPGWYTRPFANCQTIDAHF